MKATELKIKDPQVRDKIFKLIDDSNKISMSEFRRQNKKATAEDLKEMLGMIDEELNRRGIKSL